MNPKPKCLYLNDDNSPPTCAIYKEELGEEFQRCKDCPKQDPGDEVVRVDENGNATITDIHGTRPYDPNEEEDDMD